MSSCSSHIVYFDVLNILSCIAVIALHQNGIVHSFSPTAEWAESLIVEVVCYWAVPVFFMLSGAKLLSYPERYSTRAFLKRRFVKTFIPFIIWSLVWCAIYYNRSHSMPADLLEIVTCIIQTGYQPVYWFFIPLFGVYLLMPVLSLLRDNYKLIIYIELLIFICSGIIQPLISILNWPEISILNNSLSMPIFYCLAGYYLSKCNLSRRFLFILIICSVLCFLFRYFYTYYQSFKLGYTDKTLFSLGYFTAVIPAITLFEGIKRIHFCFSAKTETIIKLLASCSFGIYLVHMLVTKVCIYFLCIDVTSLIWRTLGIFFIYAISLFVVFMSKKIKIGNYIFP